MMELISPDIIGVATETEQLKTFPKNVYSPTSFLSSGLAKQIQGNTDAIVYGLTGNTLDENLTVSEGHKHDDNRSQLRWRQLATYQFSDLEVELRTTPKDLVILNLWVPSHFTTSIYIRVRVSTAAAATVLATLRFHFNESDFTTNYTKEILISTHRVYDSEWVESDGIDINNMPGDLVLTGFYPVTIQMTGHLSALTETVAIEEISFGCWSAM